VMSADRDHSIGSTRQLTDSLMMGYVDPEAVMDDGLTVRLESWLAVCREAYRTFSA
jgi:hypothetical protein